MFAVTDNIRVRYQGYFGPAKVLDLNKEGTHALIGFEKEEEKMEAWGRIMNSPAQTFSFGDLVLAGGENLNEIYILGLLESQRSSSESRITASNGAYALIENNSSGEKLQVKSKEGNLIFEYDPASGKSKINLHPADLELVSAGNISFVSEGNISFKSSQLIEMESSQGINIMTKNMIGKILTAVSLNPQQIKMSSPGLEVISHRARLQIENTRYTGNSFSAVFKQIKLIAGRFETAAGEIITKAKNVYSDIEELIQTKTARMRILINSSLHLKSKNSYLNSEEDFKVNAEKIHLG